VENFFRTRLKAQFWLDFFGIWEDGGYDGELKILNHKGRGELGVTKIFEFWENENLITDFAKIQQVDELLCKIVFFKSIMEN